MKIKINWPEALLNEGFCQTPNKFFKNAYKLKLDAIDQAILLTIIESQFEDFSPANKFLAERLMIAERTIRTRIGSLERKGVLKVIRSKKENGMNNFNIYDLSPLFLQLEALEKNLPIIKKSTRVELDSRIRNYNKKQGDLIEFKAETEKDIQWLKIEALADELAFTKEMFDSMSLATKRLLCETNAGKIEYQKIVMNNEKQTFLNKRVDNEQKSLE